MGKPVVTLYYRHGCHLCEDMLLHLQELRQSKKFLVETVDIDANSQLRERYGALVPVLEGGGQELCRYYLDEVTLRGYLSSQTSKVS